MKHTLPSQHGPIPVEVNPPRSRGFFRPVHSRKVIAPVFGAVGLLVGILLGIAIGQLMGG